MIWTREQAKALTDRALVVQQGGRDARGAHRRRSRQPALRAQHRDDVGRHRPATAWRSPPSFGKTLRHGDHRRVRRRRACSGRCANAEEIARLSPENPEAMPVLGPQTYAPVKAVLRRRGRRDARLARGRRCATAIDAAQEEGASVAAGLRRDLRRRSRRSRTSKGLFAYDRFTAADYNLTARTPDGTGSGWASKSFNELRQLEPGDAGGRRDRQGRALARARRRSSRASTPSSSSRRRWPTCSPT